MPELSSNAGVALDLIRHECRLGDPVATRTLKQYAFDRAIAPSSTRRALTELVLAGLVTQPSRGFYLPAISAEEAKAHG